MTKKLIYSKRPSPLNYMLLALIPSRGLKESTLLPALEIHLQSLHFDTKSCASLFELCEMEKSTDLPIFFPQILGFPLIMRAVTDPQFPEPIWRALQTRNVLTQYVPLQVEDHVDLKLDISALRFLEKGAEIDLRITAFKKNQRAWEGITTFYYRGKFKNLLSPLPSQPPPLTLPQASSSINLPLTGGIPYGILSGDFNGIHLSNLYARLFGFESAFLHPHRIVGNLLNRLPKMERAFPQQLELWFRGPVAYGSKGNLFYQKNPEELIFYMNTEKEKRPCIIGKTRIL